MRVPRENTANSPPSDETGGKSEHYYAWISPITVVNYVF
jgi:hypothetical protein